MKYLIVGGVAGGASTAARLRRNDEQAEIILFERGAHISFANCGLPYFLGGAIAERDELFLQTPESFKAILNVDVRINAEVVAIDRLQKQVTIKNTVNGDEYTENFDKLVLSPGAEPLRPPIPGIGSEGIFTLRNVPDIDRIVSIIEETNPKRAVIVGAGFIGLEMAENLHKKGIFVTIIEATDQMMGVLDYEMASVVHQHLKVKGVEFYLKDGVASFERDSDKLNVNLASGRVLQTDMVIFSIGVRPENSLAVDAGLQVGERGGITVDEYMQTSDPSIYAVGDAVEFMSPITGKPVQIPLAWPANFQGRIAADNIAFGNKRKYSGTIGTAIAKVFDITVASAGANEKLLKMTGILHKVLVIHAANHAGYYPGATPVSIKLLYSPEDRRVLGAQVIGYEGVDKRIDVISIVIQKNGTIDDLAEFEHAYAPPYSSAKDPVNIAGFTAANILDGRSRHISWNELLERDQSSYFLIDVRTPGEFAGGAIDGAINIPNTELRDNLDKIPRDREIIVYCGVGKRAYFSEQILRQCGFDRVANLSGGVTTFFMATQKQSNEDIWESDEITKDNDILRG